MRSNFSVENGGSNFVSVPRKKNLLPFFSFDNFFQECLTHKTLSTYLLFFLSFLLSFLFPSFFPSFFHSFFHSFFPSFFLPSFSYSSSCRYSTNSINYDFSISWDGIECVEEDISAQQFLNDRFDDVSTTERPSWYLLTIFLSKRLCRSVVTNHHLLHNRVTRTWIINVTSFRRAHQNFQHEYK